MKTTLILAIVGCLLLFEMIWIATITMPFSALAKNFPPDVQEKIRPRIEKLPLTFKRVAGGVTVILLMLAWGGLFILGGIDGRNNSFGFTEHLIRFLIMAGVVKVFDIACLDYVLLTKTEFFQHYLPETKGCEGWKQFGYNRKQQIRQCIIMPICCVVLAFIFYYI